MNGTSGQLGLPLFESAAPPSSSESKSQAQPLSEKACKTCGKTKRTTEFQTHNKGGFRGICRACANAAVRAEKPWRSAQKRAYAKKRRETHRGFALAHDAKRRAIDKGLPFDLDWRDIQERINTGVCEVTGIPFDLVEPKGWNAPSLDQIEPQAGYTRENTRVVLYALNTMANEWGTDLILRIADAIRERQSVSASNAFSRKLAERLRERLKGRGSTLFELTWRTQVTPSGHVFYRLAASPLRTSDSDFGSWPTPAGANADQGAEDVTAKRARSSKSGLMLTDVARSAWPTPRAEDSESSGMRHSRGVADTLTAVASLSGWATPAAREAGGTAEQFLARKEKARANGAELGVSLTSLSLQATLAHWPTPNAMEGGQTSRSGKRKGELLMGGLVAGWPTPDTTIGPHGPRGVSSNPSHQSANGLEAISRLAAWPTPMAGTPAQKGYNEAGNNDSSRKTVALAAAWAVSGPTPSSSPAQTGKPGQLSPVLSSWLMGYPLEWYLCAPNRKK